MPPLPRCVLLLLLLAAAAAPAAEPPQPDPVRLGAAIPLGKVRFRHGKMCLCMAVSPDGKTVVSGGDRPALCLWERSSGKHLRQWQPDPEMETVWSVVFTPDGKTLLVGGSNGRLCWWDLKAHKAIRTVEADRHMVQAVAVSPDGKRVASLGREGVLRLWDAATGKEDRSLDVGRHSGRRFLAFSPDSKLLAARTEDDGLSLWDAATGKPARGLRRRREDACAAAFSPNGKTLVLAHESGAISWWEWRTARQLHRQEGHKGGGVLAISPDNRIVASAGKDGTLCTWDLASSRLLHRWRGHPSVIAALAFSPDGKQLLSAGREGALHVWEPDTAEGLEPREDRHPEPVRLAAFLPDGKGVLSLGVEGSFRLWEVGTGKALRSWSPKPGGITCAALSPDGKQVLTGDMSGALHLWQLPTGREVRSWRGPDGPVTALAISPEGGHAAWGVYGRLCLADLNAGRLLTHWSSYNGPARFLTFTADGKTLFSTGDGRKLCQWQAADGRWVEDYQLGDALVPSAVISPDGRWAAGCTPDGLARLWQVADDSPLRLPEKDPPKAFLAAFSPDSQLLALVAKDGFSVWEVVSGQPVCAGEDPLGDVITALAFSSDGSRVVTGNVEGTLLVWSLSQLLLTARPQAGPLGPRTLEALWGDLAARDARRAQRAISLLAAAPGQAAPFLAERLRPAAALDSRHLRELLHNLDDDDFSVRQGASRELGLLGERVEGLLNRALKTAPSPEVRWRIKRLLAQLRQGQRSPEALREPRAVAALERMGTPGACRLLDQLAGGADDAPLTRLSRDARRRLGQRDATLLKP